MSERDDHPDQGWSAAFDGEEDSQALRFMLKRAQSDSEMAQRWSRWALASDLLAHRPIAPAPADFADRIAAQIASGAENVVAAPVAERGARRWMGGAFGLAIAASVAWAALTLYVAPKPESAAVSPLVQNAALQSPPAMTPVAGTPVAGLSPVQQVSVQSGATPVSYVPFRGRDAYLVRHSLGAQMAPLGVFNTASFLAVPAAADTDTAEAQPDQVDAGGNGTP